jgi:hypothetical protein
MQNRYQKKEADGITPRSKGLKAVEHSLEITNLLKK